MRQQRQRRFSLPVRIKELHRDGSDRGKIPQRPAQCFRFGPVFPVEGEMHHDIAMIRPLQIRPHPVEGVASQSVMGAFQSIKAHPHYVSRHIERIGAVGGGGDAKKRFLA